MSKLPQPRLIVFRKEPLMRAIAATGVSPVQLGIWFFFSVSLTLSVWAALSPAEAGLSFVTNVSWSISIIFVFPFVVSLTLKYYLEIPNLFAVLLDQATQSHENQTGLDEFYAWLDRRFNCYWVTGIALVLTIVLNVIYFLEILNRGQTNWMTKGGGFTNVGLYAALIQI